MSLFRGQVEHDDHGRPDIVLYPNFHRNNFKGIDSRASCYHIPLSDAWLYSEEHNPSFVENMKSLCRRIGQFFGLYHQSDVIWTPPTREEITMMADIADTIQKFLDELVSTAPITKDRGPQIGEATTYEEGRRVTRPIHANDGLDPDDISETGVTFWEGDSPDQRTDVVTPLLMKEAEDV